ncbi:hypothetical protein PspLS_00611 [Pyricularia sp. CBS 133598]|nr:hypothetical protein PspLS_00611 [Pyricularia sp. CBS 133598]
MSLVFPGLVWNTTHQRIRRSRAATPLLVQVDMLHSATARGYSRVIRERFGGRQEESTKLELFAYQRRARTTNASALDTYISTDIPVSSTMAKKVKSRIIGVRLISMAMTGFFYQMSRPRTSTPLSMLKYDPIGASKPLLHRRLPPLSKLPAAGPDLQQLTILAARLTGIAVRRKVLFLEQKRKSSK